MILGLYPAYVMSVSGMSYIIKYVTGSPHSVTGDQIMNIIFSQIVFWVCVRVSEVSGG